MHTKEIWGSFKKRRIPDVTPVEFSNYTYQDIYKYIDGMTLMWQRLFDGAVSLLRSCRMMIIGIVPNISAVFAKEQAAAAPVNFRFRMGLSPVSARGISPRSVPIERLPIGDDNNIPRRGTPRKPSAVVSS